MSPDEAREALEPFIAQMAAALITQSDDDPSLADDSGRAMSLLSGWVLVTASSWFTANGSDASTVRVTPRENQADYISIGLLENARMMYQAAMS